MLFREKEKGNGFVAKGIVQRLVVAGFALLMVSACSPYMLGDYELSHHNYEPAISYFQQSLEENPLHAPARGKLGLAYLKAGKPNQAIAEFLKVLEGNPEDCYARVYLGLAYCRVNEFNKALDIWKSIDETGKPLVENEIKRQVAVLTRAGAGGLPTGLIVEIETSINRVMSAQEEIDKQTPATPGVVTDTGCARR